MDTVLAIKLSVVLLIVSAFAVGVITYRMAQAPSAWLAVGLAIWIYNVWIQYRRVVHMLSTRETHLALTIKIPRRESAFEREESLN